VVIVIDMSGSMMNGKRTDMAIEATLGLYPIDTSQYISTTSYQYS
jgi:hypothetical protein